MLEGWSVVDPVTRHRHNFPLRLPRPNDLQLIHGRHPCIDGNLIDNLLKLLFRNLLQSLTSQCPVAIFVDPHLFCNGNGCELMVSRNHDRFDAHLLTYLYSLDGFLPGRVDHPRKAQEDHIALEVFFCALDRGRTVSTGKPKEPQGLLWQVSYGFRPGRSCHGALEHIRIALTSANVAKDGKRHANPCPWVIEGDIKGCFDNLSQHQILERIRRRCADRKVLRLIRAFLKAGILAEDQFIRTDAGTPQGGNLSPLLANIALEVIEECYTRWIYCAKDTEQHAARLARMYDRKAGRPVFFPIRYADDFVILVSGTYDDAVREKEALAVYLKDTAKLTLSQEKTRITPVTQGCEFLGHRVRLKWEHHYGFRPRIEIPKRKVADMRYRIKQWTTRKMTMRSLAWILRKLNPLLRGYGYFYRHCTGVKRILGSIDWYVGGRLLRWMRKKYPKASGRKILSSLKQSVVHPSYRVWQDGKEEQFLMGCISVQRFRLGRIRRPDYAMGSGELSA
jgi:RNA-directed DNA polymerase